MKKICINNRDELVMLHVNKIAYLLADGNYTKIVYISGTPITLSLGISKVQDILLASYKEQEVCPFVRLGRSLIINQMYLYNINVLQHRLQLSDAIHPVLTLSVPRQLLKNYKEQIVKSV